MSRLGTVSPSKDRRTSRYSANCREFGSIALIAWFGRTTIADDSFSPLIQSVMAAEQTDWRDSRKVAKSENHKRPFFFGLLIAALVPMFWWVSWSPLPQWSACRHLRYPNRSASLRYTTKTNLRTPSKIEAAYRWVMNFVFFSMGNRISAHRCCWASLICVSLSCSATRICYLLSFCLLDQFVVCHEYLLCLCDYIGCLSVLPIFFFFFLFYPSFVLASFVWSRTVWLVCRLWFCFIQCLSTPRVCGRWEFLASNPSGTVSVFWVSRRVLLSVVAGGEEKLSGSLVSV